MNVIQRALPAGTRVAQYRIEKVIGAGGFGITYKARDLLLKCDVAMKEFFPADIAVRAADSTEILPANNKQLSSFKRGLKRFLEEARTLAQFRLQTIIRIHTFLKKNGTAYIVMDYEKGIPLHAYLKYNQTLTEKEIYYILKPVLKGLKEVHKAGILHRDIKPPNIYLRKQGVPVLLDFGAAKLALMSKNVTNMVTPGYAPFEQYNTREEQGAWTDLYSLGATMYRCITGVSPVSALDRLAGLHNDGVDPLQPVSRIAAEHFNKNLLEIIDWMLKIRIEDRPQKVSEVLKKLSRTTPEYLKHEAINPGQKKRWDESVVGKFKQELSRYFDGDARHVVEKARINAEDLHQLRDLLASGIDSKVQRKLFLRKTAKYLSSPIEPQALKCAEEELEKFMGPVASIMVRQAADESRDLDDFISILSDDIPLEHEREEFTISIRASVAT